MGKNLLCCRVRIQQLNLLPVLSKLDKLKEIVLKSKRKRGMRSRKKKKKRKSRLVLLLLFSEADLLASRSGIL